MSQDRAGYRRPPKDTQFKPGQSGNPKGRPPKAPRAEIPSQIGRDLRAALRRKITINTPDGAISLTLGEAIMHRVAMDALGGKASQQKLVLSLMSEAYWENFRRDAALADFDRYLNAFRGPGKAPKEIRDVAVFLGKRSTKL